MIPVIDIFAGPGGLGEGFCSVLNDKNKRVFKIALSIEKDFYAHQTLTLRSFFRQFDSGKVPDQYYDFLKGKISLQELYNSHPLQSKKADEEAWLTTLGDSKDAVSKAVLDSRINDALAGSENWVLIGGPPCQAYSVVGRSRRQEKILDEKKDERVGLYKQYLRILAVHNPAVFVMENVKGLLSAETDKNPVFKKILEDLADPSRAYQEEFGYNGVQSECPGYKIYSLAVPPHTFDSIGNPVYDQKDFIIHAEKFGIPQTRHRVILLGVRNGIEIVPETLKSLPPVAASKVLSNLPRIRSGLSRQKDQGEDWKQAIGKIKKPEMLRGLNDNLKTLILKQVEKIRNPHTGRGGRYIPTEMSKTAYRHSWFFDRRIEGICNHEARGHMESDLLRYFFASCFGIANLKSPRLEDFPNMLLPKHGNIRAGIEEKKFADRFRVQLADEPARTITSHISKDGHYYIHYDPLQCRSLTVREAARIQTFPDNYYFCGPRTAQFSQVGNAVPPLLAAEIAAVVNTIVKKKSGMKAQKNKFSSLKMV